MKTKFNLLLACGAAALLSGCALFQSAVPTTSISGEIGGQSFYFRNPKQTTISNMVIEVGTNGAARLSIGSLNSVNDEGVVKAGYEGQANSLSTLGTQINSAIQSAVQAAK